VTLVVEMELVGVRVELPSASPIVLLKEVAPPGRLLPIFIGSPEATAIALALDEVETPRPMTHDLFKTVLEQLDVRLEKVVVTDLQGKTFFAELELIGSTGRLVISSRPSDALALAARTGTPIFAVETVLREAGYTVPEDTGDEAVLEEFRDFIDTVDPADFEP
jgi:hypothetical protein